MVETRFPSVDLLSQQQILLHITHFDTGEEKALDQVTLLLSMAYLAIKKKSVAFLHEWMDTSMKGWDSFFFSHGQ